MEKLPYFSQLWLNDMPPGDKSEIPKYHTHFRQVVGQIPSLDPTAGILILLGQDIPQAYKVWQHCNSPHNAPYTQHLDLGWVIIREVCLGSTHKPNRVNVYQTNVQSNGRTSLFEPCTNSLHIKEKFETDSLGKGVLQRTPHDNKPAMSVEDKAFLEMMDREVFMDDTNSWVVPLPLREPRHKLPSNRVQAVKHLLTLHHMFGKRPEMKEHCSLSCSYRRSSHQVMLKQLHHSMMDKSVGTCQSSEFIIHISLDQQCLTPVASMMVSQ